MVPVTLVYQAGPSSQSTASLKTVGVVECSLSTTYSELGVVAEVGCELPGDVRAENWTQIL